MPEVDEVLNRPSCADEGNHAVPCSGEGAGGVQHPLEHRLEVQALVDAQAGLAQPGEAVPQGLVLPLKLVGVPHPFDLYSSMDGPRFPSSRTGGLIIVGVRKITQAKLA